jgi:branched-subunit amino acid aminotransferase/4-amino-4-deoxychorismate lyase
MTEPVAYLNGEFLPLSRAALPIDDAGFVVGATVTEQLRTFNGRLFRVERHLQRLEHSLAICDLAPPISIAQFGEIGAELVRRNHPLLESGDDLGLSIFVTPGPYAAIAAGRRAGPTVGLHTFPLAFGLWADAYSTGVSLVTTPIQQTPPACWPPELKCRSRMHYYLADRWAAKNAPGSRALLLDAAGHVVETSTANIILYRPDKGLVTPPRNKVLPGVSMEALFELAAREQITVVERELTPDDVAAAGEVFLTSTPNCMLPVCRFNSRPIGNGQPGLIFRRLLAAWSNTVGLDIAAQAARFASRSL